MQVEIRGRVSRQGAVDYADKRVRFALDHLAHAAFHVQVRLHTEGRDNKCRLICELRATPRMGVPAPGLIGHKVLVVEASSDDLFEAIDHAADRLRQSASREIARSRERTSERILVHLDDESDVDVAPLSMAG